MNKSILCILMITNLLIADNNNYEATAIFGKVNKVNGSHYGYSDFKNYKIAGVSVSKNINNNFPFDKLELGILQSLHFEHYGEAKNTTPITRIFLNTIKDYKINDTFKVYGFTGLGYKNIFNEILPNKSTGVFNYGIGTSYSLTDQLSLKFDLRHELHFDAYKNILYTMGIAVPFGKVVDNKYIKKPTIVIKEEKNVVILHFSFNSIEPDNKNKDELIKFAHYLKQNKQAIVLIESHTDSIGSYVQNQKISELRAKTIKKKLIDMGINTKRIQAVGYGEKRPIASNMLKAGRDKNRRIIMTLINK